MAALRPKYTNTAIKSLYGFFSGEKEKIAKYTDFIAQSLEQCWAMLSKRFGMSDEDIVTHFKEPIVESEEERGGFVAGFDTAEAQMYICAERALDFYVNKRMDIFVPILVHEIEHALQTEAVGKIEDDSDWQNSTAEQGAEIARIRALVESGVPEKDLIKHKHPMMSGKMWKSLVRAYKDIDPNSTAY